MKRLNTLAMWIGIALVAAAVGQELRKPPKEREWHGRVAGVVPYDFRPPTLKRLRDAYWNPDYPHVFTDRVLGVGWGVNVPILLQRLRSIGRVILQAAGPALQ